MTDQAEFSFKYEEDLNIEKFIDFVKGTYTNESHYVGEGSDGIQVQEFLASIGVVKPFCIANAIKYAARFGKKDGHNTKDIYKAMHYLLILLHYLDTEQVKDAPEEVEAVADLRSEIEQLKAELLLETNGRLAK